MCSAEVEAPENNPKYVYQHRTSFFSWCISCGNPPYIIVFNISFSPIVSRFCIRELIFTLSVGSLFVLSVGSTDS